jgi:HEAT repeat protein
LTSALLTALLVGGLAAAGAVQDLGQAADPSLPKAAREEAFARLVAGGVTDLGPLEKAALDTRSGDTRGRWVAIRALGKVGGDQARRLLAQLAADPEPAIRAAAAHALGDLGDPSMGANVVDLLADPAVIVRAAAAEAACRLSTREAVEPLSQALLASDGYYRGSSLWVRRHYVDALGCIGGRGALPALLRALDDRDESVATGAVDALEKLAGFSYEEGRSPEEQKEAWRRWAQAQLR